MFWSKKKKNKGDERNQQINTQIEDLENDGITYHYDRKERLKNQRPPTRSNTRRSLVLIMAIILAICAFLANYNKIISLNTKVKSESLKDKLVYGDNIILNLSVFNDAKKTAVESKIFARYSDVTLSNNNNIIFVLSSVDSDLDTNNILLKQGTKLCTSKTQPQYKICTFDLEYFQKAVFLQVRSQDLGIDEIIKLK